jgi:uncharacterized protein (TIGR03118 family)
MKDHHSRAAWLVAGVAAVGVTGVHADDDADTRPNSYSRHFLVSDGVVSAAHTDANLKNPWGVAFNPFGDAWVADNETSMSTLYDGEGNPNSLVVSIPPGVAGEGSPTGLVYNGSPTDFVVSDENGRSGPAVFIFAGEHGTISGWSPDVDSSRAILVHDDGDEGAIYKGIALAGNGTENHLYVTDFHNRSVDVYDSHFHEIDVSGGFRDPAIPSHYAPFGIQNILGSLYVTFARQDAAGEDDVPGPGFGYLDVFDVDGHLIRRLISRGALNAPWGMALAPATFGRFSNRLLVGNFGNGMINAFNPDSGEFVGTLRASDGNVMVNDGLWGIAFGTGLFHQDTNALFFTAGPNDESDGVYGRIDPAMDTADQ